MSTIKINSKIEEAVWEELKELAKKSDQDISDLLAKAISEYIHRRRVRPAVMEHLKGSVDENEELGKLLSNRST